MTRSLLLKFTKRGKYLLAAALVVAGLAPVLFPQSAAAAGESFSWQTTTSGGKTVNQIVGAGGDFVNEDTTVVVFTQAQNTNKYIGQSRVTNCGTGAIYTITVSSETKGTISTDIKACAPAANLSGEITITGGAPSGATGGTTEENKAPVEEADWCDKSAGEDVAWWICGPVNIAADTIAKLDCQILDLLKIDTVTIFNVQGQATTAPPNCGTRIFQEGAPSSHTADSSNAYRASWSAFRNIALAILVILGLIMVASQILGLDIFDAYTIRKMLPKLIIATIFLTLSWNIMQFLFTASNAAADAIMAIIGYPFRNMEAANGATFSNATLSWIIPTLLLGATAATIGVTVGVGLLGFGGILALLGSLLLAIFSAWVLLVARDIVATILIVIAPLAIICAAYEPFEKLYSFWKGILITLLISVPALAAVLAFSHAGAFISLIGDSGSNGRVIIAMIILLAGYGMLWAVFKQLDKVTGYFGNVMSQATGRAQKALSDYRGDTMKRRRQEAIEGQRNIPFGRTMRRMSLAGQAGKGNMFTRHGRAQLVAAEQALMQRSAAKRLEEEGGRMSGDDDAMALAMQRGMTRERFISEYQRRTGRDGRRALADMEASFGAQVGTQAMRVSAAKSRWASVSAYNDFDIDTPEGARNMYRQMTQEAAEMVADGQMSVTDVVSAMKKNTQRADISGHSFPQMMGQIQMAADRLQDIRAGRVGPNGVVGRVMDENGVEVPGMVQATGSSVRRNRDGHIVGQGANLVSDSEIDNWMRGSLEYAMPGQIVGGRTETVRILGNQMRERLERSVVDYQQATAAAAANPGSPDAQQRLARSEREVKRQVAALAGRYDVMAQISPENARYMAENVMEHSLNVNGGGPTNIQQLIEAWRADPEFQQYRREYNATNAAAAQAQQQAAAAAAGGQPPGQMPNIGGPVGGSDRWLKRDIIHVGTAQNGTINLYRFKYLWDDQEYVGVMAQEILTTHPQAVIVGPTTGYYLVNYEMLGVPFLTFEEWQAAQSPAKRR